MAHRLPLTRHGRADPAPALRKGMMMDIRQRQSIEWECQRLIHLYANLNDEGRWHDVAALYTEDGVMVRPSAPQAPVAGRERICASFLARPARASRHVCANVVVSVISAEEALAHSLILMFTGTAAGDGALPILNEAPPLIANFDDRLHLTTDGWRFAERRGSLCFAPR